MIKVMVLLNKERLWEISVVLFIFGGIFLAITWPSFVGYYHPPPPPCLSVSQCPPHSLPARGPTMIHYFFLTLTTAFFALAIALLIISRNKSTKHRFRSLI